MKNIILDKHLSNGKDANYKYLCSCGCSFYIQKDLWMHCARENCTIDNLIKYNFSPIIYKMEYSNKDFYYQVKCDFCGKIYHKKSFIRQLRHSSKHKELMQ